MNEEIPSAWSRAVADLLAEVVMASTNHDGPFLIVEGPTDQRFLEMRVDAAVYFVQAGGKTTCLALVRALNSEIRKFNYLGIADEDFDWLDPETAENLVLTDTRDLECILIRSSALDSAMVELSDPARVDHFIQENGIGIREAVLRKALFFGRIRTLAFQKGSTVCLDEIKPSRFCNRDWTYDEDACARACVRIGLADSVHALLSEANGIVAPTDWHFARGHDLVDILVGGLIHSLSGKTHAKNHVEALLRQSMQRLELETTELFRRVSDWEVTSGQRIWKVN